MYNETLNNLPADVAIFSAAVSDYKVKNYENKKIKKEEKLNLDLIKNIDILSNISNHNSLRPKLTIGFAAETNDLVKNSLKKLEEKNCDWIVANDVSNEGSTMGGDFNAVSLVTSEGVEEWPKLSKIEVGMRLAEKISTVI